MFGLAASASLTSSSAVVSCPRLKYAVASSTRVRARLLASDSSDSVTRSLPSPEGEEGVAQPATKELNTQQTAAAHKLQRPKVIDASPGEWMRFRGSCGVSGWERASCAWRR